MMSLTTDKTALSYWFPKLVAAGLPVPRTIIVEATSDECLDIGAGIWGEEGDGSAVAFLARLKQAADSIGYPCFLRTDHTSNKHQWEKTCFLQRSSDLVNHVAALAEFSEICDFIGLPYRNWVVREYLPIIPFGSCPRYGNMPVCREFRFFVDNSNIRCIHPYWPMQALKDGGVGTDLDYGALCEFGGDADKLKALAVAAGHAVGGSWSIDILETLRGWYVTDMAEAKKSFHWEGCPHVD